MTCEELKELLEKTNCSKVKFYVSENKIFDNINIVDVCYSSKTISLSDDPGCRMELSLETLEHFNDFELHFSYTAYEEKGFDIITYENLNVHSIVGNDGLVLFGDIY